METLKLNQAQKKLFYLEELVVKAEQEELVGLAVKVELIIYGKLQVGELVTEVKAVSVGLAVKEEMGEMPFLVLLKTYLE